MRASRIIQRLQSECHNLIDGMPQRDRPNASNDSAILVAHAHDARLVLIDVQVDFLFAHDFLAM
ncbi:hypothetical protein CBF45_07540 [Bordetella sp. J329]|nr:hypothetical protein CBF45_07540 [Bordetella sp. J329]